MKRIIAIAAIIILSACSTPPTTQSVQVTYTQACTAYDGAFKAALDARKAGKLSPTQIQTIGKIDAQITPLCTGALPADPQAAVVQITSAIATMAATQGAAK
jgi:hypothetical protein